MNKPCFVKFYANVLSINKNLLFSIYYEYLNPTTPILGWGLDENPQLCQKHAPKRGLQLFVVQKLKGGGECWVGYPVYSNTLNTVHLLNKLYVQNER